MPQVDFIEQAEEISVWPYKLNAGNSVTDSVSITSNGISTSKKIKPIANGKAIYLSIRVKNIGNKTAENVQVFAKNLECIEGPLKCKKWPLAMDLQWGNTGDSFYPQIHPDTERYCNIGIIGEPKSRKHDPRYFYDELKDVKYKNDDPALLINIKYPLRKGDHIIGPGKYKLELFITATGIKLKKCKVVIDFDKWYDDDIVMHKSIDLYIQNIYYYIFYFFNSRKISFSALCSALKPINERCQSKEHKVDRMKQL